MSLSIAPRVGVFICECGGQISGVLDTHALSRSVVQLPNVSYAQCEAYPCSKDGQLRIQGAISEQGLERILVAGCAPRLVRSLFEKTLNAAGLEPSYLDIRDIREGCVYVHPHDPGAAFEKSVNLIEMGVERLTKLTPPRKYTGRVLKSVLVVGTGLSGLTVASSLADNGIDITLIEHTSALGGSLRILQEHAQELIYQQIETVLNNPHIRILLNAQITEATGQPGDYHVKIYQDGKVVARNYGAILITSGAEPKRLAGERWYDRQRVKTQLEYSAELETTEKLKGLALKDIVMILYAEGVEDGSHLQLNSMACIHQAIRTKLLNPQANITVLFRDLYLGSVTERGVDDFLKAKELGITFFRYQEGHPPIIGDQTIQVNDELTGEAVFIPFDQAVLALPLVPQEYILKLASIFQLPQDESGFLRERRVRLRPGHFVEDGIFILGSAHRPTDTAETLFQAYLSGARALRFLNQMRVSLEVPIAEINIDLCTGCGNCVQVCPVSAINLDKRDGLLSQSKVDALRCNGCGNCVVVCPVKAINLPGWNDAAILAQISAALNVKQPDIKTFAGTQPDSRVVVLACEWSALAAAEIAGTRRFSYPSNVRIIRMNCSARFDPNLILWAFLNGARGVFLGACHPGECHYGKGNLYARERVEALKLQLQERGIDSNRLRLQFLAGDDGEGFARAITSYVDEVCNAQCPGIG